MSTETAAPAAAPETGPAPETAAPQDAPEAPQQTEGGEGEGRQRPEPAKTAQEARQRLKDRARGRTTPDRPSEAGEGEQESVAKRMNRGDPGLPRDQKGKWRSPEEEAAAAESDVGPSDEAPKETTRSEGAPPPEGGTEVRGSDGQVPEGMVRIPLPQGHPLTHKGVTHLDFPSESEQYGRWAVNQGMRVQEFEQQKTRMQEAEEQSEAARAEAKFWQEHAGEFFGPEFYQTYQDLLNTYGEDRAEYYKAGVMAKAQEQVREAQDKARETVRNREVMRGAQEFRQMAHRAIERVKADPNMKGFDHWGPADVDRALSRYGQWMEANGRTEFNPKEFQQVATQLYLKHPRVQEQMRAQAAKNKEKMREQMKREAEEEVRAREQERLKAAAEGRRRNPLQRAPNVDTGRQSIGTGADDAPSSAKEMRERIRNRARGRR